VLYTGYYQSVGGNKMAYIEIKDLMFKYNTQNAPIIQNVNISIKKGQLVVVCGKTGCGKTTLLKSLKPLIREGGSQQGNVLVNGRDIRDYSDREQAEKIGYVMQHPDHQIVTDKVWHELAFGMENLGEKSSDIQSRVWEIAEYFNITDWFEMDTDKLSGGQKQLLNLAAVMVMNPEVLVLDEPTASLDPVMAERFLDIVVKVCRDFDVTIIMAEHRLDYILEKADSMIVLKNGTTEQYDDLNKGIKAISRAGLESLAPIPTRVFLQNNGKGQCPLSIREGRSWILKNIPKRVNDTENGDGNYLVNKGKEYIHTLSGEKETNCVEKKKNVVIKCKNVWFRYSKNDKDILKGVNLNIYKGEIFGLLGGNGTGKTTTMNLLAGKKHAYRGRVSVKERALFLPQDVQVLFQYDTVEAEVRGSDKQLVEEMELDRLLDVHPYDLSGGQQQKLGLIKLLKENPDIILLDEPTKGIDNIYKEQLGELLVALKNQGKTIVLVSHDLDFCGQYADRCAMLANGQIVLEKKSGDFFASNRFYTTTVSKMTKGIVEGAYRLEDVRW
jgi:energy-coupling factor transport system ATP-binding protein